MTRPSRSGLLLSLLVACKESPPETTRAASASSRGSLPAASASARPESVPRAKPTCRALGVQGSATVDDVALRSGDAVDGATWVTLAAGASLTLKHTTSGRELAVTGPALFRACERGREQLLLARGTLQAGSGMGSRPGAEVLIATPIATVRYADAELTLALDAKRLSLAVRAGRVELDSAAEPPPPGFKSPLGAKDKLSLPLGKPDPARLIARCRKAAEAAEATARKVGDRHMPEPLGERAQAHVRARRAARAACTVAAAATGLVADPNARAGLWAEVSASEERGEALPRPVRAKPAEK